MRTRRSILSFVSGEISTAVVVGIGVISTPLLLRWLGAERYGAFEVATDWFGYVALLELGIDGALRPLLARASASHDENRVEILMAGGIEAYTMLAALMVIAGVALTIAIPKLLSASAAATRDLQIGCLVGVAGLMLVPFVPFRALFEAEQKGYFINVALLSQSVLITACSLLFAWARWGIKGQFVAVLLGACVFNALVAYRGVRHLGGLRKRFRNVRASSEWAAIWKLNWPTFGFNTCRQVGFLTDNIIIAALISPAMVVPFFLTQRLATLAQRELQGIGNASWVALAELHVQRQTAKFNSRVIELTKLVAIFAVGGLVPIVVYNRHFIGLWVGARCYGGDLLTLVAAVNAFLLAILSLWGWCISGTGQVARALPGTVAQTIINLSLSLLFTIKFGLIGPVLGTLVGFLLVSSWYIPYLLHRLFDTSVPDLMSAALLPLLTAVPPGVVLWRLSLMFPPRGWLELGTEMTLAAAFYLIGWWVIGFNSAERDVWRQRAYALVPSGLY